MAGARFNGRSIRFYDRLLIFISEVHRGHSRARKRATPGEYLRNIRDSSGNFESVHARIGEPLSIHDRRIVGCRFYYEQSAEDKRSLKGNAKSFVMSRGAQSNERFLSFFFLLELMACSCIVSFCRHYRLPDEAMILGVIKPSSRARISNLPACLQYSSG